MTDEALRALERGWRATDDPAEDEVVRLLVDRGLPAERARSPRERLLDAFDDRFLRLRLSISCPLDEARLLKPALRELPRLHPDAGGGHRPALALEVRAAREAILGWALGISAPGTP